MIAIISFKKVLHNFGGGDINSLSNLLVLAHPNRRLIGELPNIPDKKRNAPLRTVQLSGESYLIDQFSLYQCKCMSSTAASHVFCKLASKLC